MVNSEFYKDLSVIIATYNEEENIRATIEEVASVLPGAEIIVVDDGSEDRTYKIARDTNVAGVKVIRLNKNMGKGYAIREGIRSATRDIMAQLDGDLQFLPEDIKEMVGPIRRKEADIVLGSRYIKGSFLEDKSVTTLKRFASFITSAIVSIFCWKRLTDVFAGIKAWDSQTIREISLRENGFSYEAEIAIAARYLRKKILEIPVRYKKRIYGESKIRFLHDTIIVSYSLVRIKTQRCILNIKRHLH